MKTRAVIAIFVALIPATPAVAGQGNIARYDTQSFDSGETSTRDAQISSNCAEQGTRHTLPEPCQLRPTSFWAKLWGKLTGKKQEQCELLFIRDRVNELDELTARNAKMIKDVDARAQAGVQLVSAKANEAEQRATDAGNRAQQAQQVAIQSASRLTTIEQVVGNIDNYEPTIQTEIHFRPSQTILSQQAKNALDEIATPLKEQHGYIVEVQGFSSEGGDTGIQESQVIADSVARYLIANHDIPTYRIYEFGLGTGPFTTPEPGLNQEFRGGRVKINILKNGLEQLPTSTRTQGDEIPGFPWPHLWLQRGN
jgi:outer membrane protein OmpA-like peptidoglycan-associated protein